MIAIKNEPLECDEESVITNFINSHPFIDEFSLEDLLTRSYDDIDLNIDDKVEFSNNEQAAARAQQSPQQQRPVPTIQQRDNDLKIENIFSKLVHAPTGVNKSTSKCSNRRHKVKSQVDQMNANESHQQQKQLRLPTINPGNDTFEALKCDYDLMSTNDEDFILKQLNVFFNCEENSKNIPNSVKHALRRYKCKLNLRRLKRLKRLKLFDVDSYTNELIDNEKSRRQQKQQQKEQQKQHLQISTGSNSNDVEIIAVYRVLDRFNQKSKKFTQQFGYSLNLSYKIGLIEYRNDDIKCIVSPYSKNLLKPYIRRDFESWPLKLRLHKELHDKCSHSNLNAYLNLASSFERSSIDYVYLRPEHVLVINYLCKTYFWTGIDVTECLQYPDYTCVALYRKIIIGFAFVVPKVSHEEDYLSFIFVHPNWRHSGIAKYMLWRLANQNLKNDLILHVSVSNSQAILLYQKFGFQIKEYIKHFYDKYYIDDKYDSMNKDAFLMKLTR